MENIRFDYPFTGFNNLTFINCFASMYMFLEQIKGVDEYDCPVKEGKNCNGCGNCNNSTSKKQENYYFLFDTLSGRSSIRLNFEDTTDHIDNTDDTIEWLLGFTGYQYRKAESDLAGEIRSSIASDKPILARMKEGSNGRFRVITGYNGDSLLMAEPTAAQDRPDRAPALDEIECTYAITGKSKPKYLLVDGFRRIRKIMERNRDENIWGDCIRRFMYWDEKLADVDFDEIKRRFKRITAISWHNFNCHNFAETFRHRITEPLHDKRFDEPFRQISESYDNSHTRNWQIIGLNDCRDWSTRRYNELEWTTMLRYSRR